MSKPELTVIEGGKVEVAETPECVPFTCWKCAGPCMMHPRAKPIAVQHCIPACEEWKKIETKKEELERFLIKCDVHLHVPKDE